MSYQELFQVITLPFTWAMHFFIYNDLTIRSADHATEYQMVGASLNDEEEWMWQKQLLPDLDAGSQHLPSGTEKH